MKMNLTNSSKLNSSNLTTISIKSYILSTLCQLLFKIFCGNVYIVKAID